MSLTQATPAAPAGRRGATSTSRRTLLGGIATMLGSGASNQVGAAIGSHAFPTIGPVGVVAVRQFVAAAVLVPLARPAFRRFTWAQWWPTLLLGVVFAVMNIALYSAIDRIGLGLAVTLEFLGPLAVGLAGTRGRLEMLCAIFAGVGVYVLILPGPSTDYFGVALGMLAATCWAAYILLNRLLGQRLPGLQAPAAATSVSALIYLPVAAVMIMDGRLGGIGLLYAAAAGLLSSVIPYIADLVALRRVPAAFFGVFMSINPVLAAITGMLLLGQNPALHEWIGIAIVVAANGLVTLSAAKRIHLNPPGVGRISPGRPGPGDANDASPELDAGRCAGPRQPSPRIRSVRLRRPMEVHTGTHRRRRHLAGHRHRSASLSASGAVS